ncbi:VOC family protein [Paraburkholderia flagellata]|uniref:VOC family protein n=1 Tax=Paraburkholderia flagellata TaxID=2883241 RepID=UPI001F1A2336|nr:VOC family protein [Paraburkholderia flagellata]
MGTAQSQQSTAAHALRLNNIALAVANLDTMVAWYVEVLGLVVAAKGHFDSVGADYVMLDGMGFRLELVSRIGTPKVAAKRTPPPEHLDETGWKALVLESADLAAMTATLARHDVEIVWAQVQLTPDISSTMIRDPEGNLVHILGQME